jgi:chromosome segregation and condensation protein ScpB
MSVAYLQPVTRAGIWKFLARYAHDMIVAPQEEELIATVNAAARQVDISL